MIKIRICSDLEECRHLWQQYWPVESLFDLWPVRACFQEAFNHTPFFLVAERNGNIQGLIALSRIEDEQYFGHFPGETWQGKTWLEQNKIVAADTHVYQALVQRLPEFTIIRYLTEDSLLPGEEAPVVDELGYLFFPGRYDYSFNRYQEQFSGKSRKKLGRELDKLKAFGLAYRHDCLEDIDHLFKMNLNAFHERSYFWDPRFLKSFENLVIWLHENRLLRVKTVILGGKVAAVDIGSVFGSAYTVLAGGAHSDFAGVAKLINFHHMEWASRQRLEVIDFLCGEFGWKKRFHLTPRPLYQLGKPVADVLLSSIPKSHTVSAHV